MEKIQQYCQQFSEGTLSRRAFISRLLALGVSLPVIEALMASPRTASAQAPKQGGKVRWGMTREAAGPFDPALAVGSTSYYNHWVYESLVDIDEDYANVIPRLAESWQPEDQGRAWVFQLRKGVLFHHGREFQADDVLYTFKRILDPDFGSSARAIFQAVQDVAKLDAYTVRFTLAKSNADFPVQLSAFNARIVPHDLTNEQIEREPRGTGPFRIDRYAHADRISFYRNQDYWVEGIPYLEEVEFLSIPEPMTLANAVLAGEVDVYHSATSQIVQVVQNKTGIRIVPTPPLDKHQMFMQIDTEPFNDDRVRRAFKLIGDRAVMTKVAWPDIQARPDDDNPVIPPSPFHIDTAIWKQDLAEAKRLISEAGQEGLEVTLWAINDDPGILEFCLVFANWAKEAGVTIHVEGIKSDRYYAEKWPNVPFGTVNWAGRATVDEQLRIAYHSEAPWNETHYRNPAFDELLDKALAETDEEKRAGMYAELQQMLIREGGQIIPYHYPRISIVRNRVQDYKPHPLSGLNPRYVWVSES